MERSKRGYRGFLGGLGNSYYISGSGVLFWLVLIRIEFLEQLGLVWVTGLDSGFRSYWLEGGGELVGWGVLVQISLELGCIGYGGRQGLYIGGLRYLIRCCVFIYRFQVEKRDVFGQFLRLFVNFFKNVFVGSIGVFGFWRVLYLGLRLVRR